MPEPLQIQAEAVQFLIEVAANSTEIVNHGGTFVRVRSANRTFQLRLGNKAPFELIPGSEYHSPAGAFFPSLTIINPNAATLIVTLLIGQGDILAESTPQLEWPTKLVANAAVTLGAATALDLSGTPAAELVLRKEVLVSNLDPSLNLQIRDSGGVVGLTIFPQTSVAIPVSDFVRIYNANGSAVALSVSEVWFFNP